MAETVIQVENISKLYRLGKISSGSLRQDMQYWWGSSVLKKKNNFFGPDDIPGSMHINNDFIWALRNVSFDIQQGEVWGIVGRNGAGKSTLLKILSRIIRPTKGVIRGKGKISSLLEVGTGFHYELTGRENIFISGSMLGMKKKEIRSKFDEIVEFSGIEQFLDTPVKRYSSGMYVRLAFAVAANLDPDILIVDEALAVGDAEFQKKCIGKMKDVSTKSGRTIIFVSHNMQAISTLCSKTIWLEKGSIVATGDTKNVVNQYLGASQRKIWKQEWNSLQEAPGNEYIKMLSVELIPHLKSPLEPIDIRTSITVRFAFHNLSKEIDLSVNLLLFTLSGDCIFDIPARSMISNAGIIKGECIIPGDFLNDGSYYFSIYFGKDTSQALYTFDECLHFDVQDYRENSNWYGKWWGYVRPQFPFTLKECNT